MSSERNVRTMRGNGTDGSNFDEWVVKTEEEAKSSLFDSEIFVEVRETTSGNHVAGEVLTTGTAELDVVLQVTEATTDSSTRLDDTFETCKTLTKLWETRRSRLGQRFIRMMCLNSSCLWEHLICVSRDLTISWTKTGGCYKEK